MIIKNEEKYIESCLENASKYCDEIIIADTGSTDSGINICKKFTDKIFYFEWISDFSAARNFSVKRAVGNWIMVLDADEILKIPCKKELSNYLERLPEDVAGIQFEINNISENENSREPNPEVITRLFKNDLRFFFSGSIHESVNDSIKNHSFKLSKAPWIINHYGYLKNSDNKEKSRTYLKAILNEINKKPDDWKYYGFAAIEYDKLSEFDNEENMLQKALELSNYIPDIIFKLGVFYAARKNNYEKAIDFFLKLENDTTYKFSAISNLLKCYLSADNLTAAENYFEKNFISNKDSEEIITLGLSLYRKLNSVSKIVYLINKLLNINKKPEYYFELAGRYIELGNFSKAEKILSEGLTYFPNYTKLITLKNKLENFNLSANG